MSEHEKRLRESLGPSMLHHLEMLLVEKADEISRARAEALEEAATEMDGLAASAKVEGDDDGADAYEVGAEYLRALITTPAPATIPVGRVREMFREALEYSWLRPAQATALARILGVDLDDKGNGHG